jgi:hypothetical protein
MKTIIKRAVVFAFCRGWISLMTAQRLFERLTLGRF